MGKTKRLGICLGVLLLGASACGDDADGGGYAGGGGGSGSGGGAGTSGGGGGSSADAGPGDDSGLDAGVELGPTAEVRVANLVPGVTFDAFSPDIHSKPVRVAEGLVPGAISDYFPVRVNPISMDPIFVLWKSGDAPTAEQTFSMLQDDTHERVRIEVGVLDGEGERGTVILSPIDDSAAATLQFGLLDETELNRGEPTQANLHISTDLVGLSGGAQPSVGVAGASCLFHDSTSPQLVHSVPPGSFELGVYDTQTGADCSAAPVLATHALEVAAGDNVLVVMYRDGDAIEILSAPIPTP